MQTMIDMQQRVINAYHDACMAELQALKPGNVHIFADGHNMTIDDFVHSAKASAGVIAAPDISVGARILNAVTATQQAVQCNTNLGMVLLIAPLIQAMFHLTDAGSQTKFSAQTINLADIKTQLSAVLSTLTVNDAQQTAQAICLANPAGLGQVDAHDVHAPLNVDLYTLMQTAETRDRIAYQYTHGFSTVLDIGYPHYQQAYQQWQNPAWATTALYLYLLSHYPDSHITRKYGEDFALQVMQEAQIVNAAFYQAENPKLQQKPLLAFDADLKARRINPGTTADLTVAVLFVANMLSLHESALYG